MTPIIHERNDIVESEINIEKNVFSIGIMESGNRSDFHKIIREFSIPEDAVEMYETEPVQLLSSSKNNEMIYRSNHTLEDRVRPVRGGLRIARPIPNDPTKETTCTFGFNIKLNGTDMWVTNSHCIYQFSNTGNTPFYQHTSSNSLSSRFVGTEFRDYQGSGSWRYSDAAIIDHSGGQSLEFAGIFATEYAGVIWGDFGSIDLVPYQNDYGQFEIIHEFTGPSDIFNGLQINKVGRRTGWTLGFVKSTCMNISNISDLNGWSLYCQIRSNVYSRGGDSGSPVFFYDHPPSSLNEPAALIGIHWGRTSNRSYHSYIDGIRFDLLQSGETMTTY